jgi:hypothetical protein
MLLLVSLFLNWYTLPVGGLTAWTAFEVWDVVLAATAVAAFLCAATDLGWWRGPLPVVRLPTLGVAAVVIVASQLVNRPPSVVDSAIGSGGWLGLVGAAGIAVGALIADSRLTVSFDTARDPARPSDRAAARVAPQGRWTAARRPRRPNAPVDPGVAGAPADPLQGAPAEPTIAARPADPLKGAQAEPAIAGTPADQRKTAGADAGHAAPEVIEDETVRIVPADPPPPRRT